MHKIRQVPWRNLPAIQAQFDINLAPLRTDNPFSQSKSEIKYVEAALLKIPTIASPTEAFRFAIRQNFNGILAETAQEWEIAMEKLILEPGYRRELGEVAYQETLQHYHPQVRARELVDTLGSLSAADLHRRDRDGDVLPQIIDPHQHFWTCAQYEKTPTLFQMGLYTLRQRGIATLARQVRIYIRRFLSPIFPYHVRQ
jgi:hypothetical protein